MEHITVLQNEAVDALAIQPASIIVDATLGAGGHAESIIKALSDEGSFVGIDVDPNAIADVAPLLPDHSNIHLVNRNFADIGIVLDELNIIKVDGILADLGWRSDQFIAPGKGFSFNDEAGLLMTFGQSDKYLFTAYDIVNDWEEESIADVIYGYGEEHYSRKIAKAIIEARRKTPITNAKQLAEIIKEAVPPSYRKGRLNPATKTFQALRIAVNDEFAVLERFIREAFLRLNKDGRLAIITFHSLEDRIVKLAFRSYTHDQTGVLITKKPIVASREELLSNPRSRSAKLRVIKKI